MSQGPSLHANASVAATAAPVPADKPQESALSRVASWCGHKIASIASPMCQMARAEESTKSQPPQTELAERQTKLQKSDIVHLHRVGSGGLDEYNPALHREQLELCQEKLEKKYKKNEQLRPRDGFTTMKKLGEGGYGAVHSVFEGLGGEVGVQKRMPPSKANLKETELIQKFDHPNIVKAQGVSITEVTDDKGELILDDAGFSSVQELNLVMDNGGHSMGDIIDAARLYTAAAKVDPDSFMVVKEQVEQKFEEALADVASLEELEETEQAQLEYWVKELDKMVILPRNPAEPVGPGNRITFSPLPMEIIQSSMKQLSSALNHMHNEHLVVHCDIKPENLLLNGEGKLTLCDFGVAIDLSAFDPEADALPPLNTVLGTPNYLPPEVCEAHVSPDSDLPMTRPDAIDTWALGCTLYEMVFGHMLFRTSPDEDESLQEQCRSVMARQQQSLYDMEWRIDAQIESLCSQADGYMTEEQGEQLKDLLMALLQEEPTDRMIIDDVLTHPFLANAQDRPFPQHEPANIKAAQKAQEEQEAREAKEAEEAEAVAQTKQEPVPGPGRLGGAAPGQQRSR